MDRWFRGTGTHSPEAVEMKVFLSYEPLADEAFAQKMGKALTDSGIQVTSVNL